MLFEFQEDYPKLSISRIREILENRLIDLFKESIRVLDIPNEINLKYLKLMRGNISVKQKSSRWDRKIDSLINKFNKSRSYLKYKGIQDELRTWDKFTSNNNLTTLTNGSSFKIFDSSHLEFNGNKNVDTRIEFQHLKKNQSSIDIENVYLNDGGYESLGDEFKTVFGFYEDSVKDHTKLDIPKEEEEDLKIPLDNSLLERIRLKNCKPIEKKETRDLSILALEKEIDDFKDK